MRKVGWVILVVWLLLCAIVYELYEQHQAKMRQERNGSVKLELRKEKDSVKILHSEKKDAIEPSEAPKGVKVEKKHEGLRYLEVPLASNKKVIVGYRRGFTFGYSQDSKQSLWVAYEFVRSELAKRVKRAKDFREDPEFRISARNSDYIHTGYDKGHLAPAGDMAWSKQAMRESFYFTNISPQVAAFNRGIWKRLEEQVRAWVARYDTVYVTTGPLFLKKCGVIGKNRVRIPSHFYKALLIPNRGNWQAVAFLLPNEASRSSINSFRCTVDSLEQCSGLDFFPLLPDSIEIVVEQDYNKVFWNAR